MKTIAYDKQTVNNSFLFAFFTHTCHVRLMKTIAYEKQTVNNSFLVAFFTRTCHVILMKTIAYDKQTVNNSFLFAFFTHTCHVILMKTIAYVTVPLNKNILNIIERHELFDSLFSTIIIKGGDIRELFNIKINNDRALLGFHDLGRSVTPILPLSTHCPKLNENSMWEGKINSRFLSTGHRIMPSCASGCKARETVVS